MFSIRQPLTMKDLVQDLETELWVLESDHTWILQASQKLRHLLRSSRNLGSGIVPNRCYEENRLTNLHLQDVH